MNIYQIIVTLAHGDAIGNNTQITGEIIKGLGYKTQIYAENFEKIFSSKVVLPFDKMPTPHKDDIVIYQMCECSKINKILPEWNCKKIAVYHNITPPHFFHNFSPMQENYQHTGLYEIEQLKDCFDLVIAVSNFNKSDLISMGYSPWKIKVLPIILKMSDYKQTPDSAIINKYSDSCTNILFVGRIAPNKKIENIIRIFAYYKQHYDMTARLFLIGSFFNKEYQKYLEKYINIIGVNDVIFCGHISFAEVLAFYSVADMFLCMSEHEGFCVPLVEAMIFDTPIIAYGTTAIPETLGGSGLLSDTNDPVFVAELMNKIREDVELRQQIVEGQRKRLHDFEPEILAQQFVGCIQDVINEVK